MSSDVVQHRTSERGAATRNALLAAATEVFASDGFAQAGVTEIVAKAGASVGSLYHHFSGKADLFLTLFDEFQKRQQERARTAAFRVLDLGETDPKRIFVAGARAYLDGCFEEARLSRLFQSGDGPPGFEVIMRRSLRHWADVNIAMFEKSGKPDEALVVVLTGAMVSAVSEISGQEGSDHARALADRVLDIMEHIESPAPGTP
ncbi:MAG TPA: TetR/AcrR family transcriptional regulator [Streptosporangiaceae bacterium]|jgi:AcrR family transcriptional regulator